MKQLLVFMRPGNRNFLCAEPTMPRAVAVRTADEDSITIEWAEPDPPHGIITNYDLAFWRTGENSTREERPDIGASNLFYEISNLDINATYSMQVKSAAL